jgi:hypothetical protein
MGYQKYVPNNRLHEFVLVATSRFNTDVVQKRVLDGEEMMNELYRHQRKNLSMSLMNFDEIPKIRSDRMKYCFFQHRYLFEGRSFCSLFYISMKNNLDLLSDSMSVETLSSPNSKALGNSSISLMVGTDKSEKTVEDRYMIFNDWFNVDRLHMLQADLNYQSFIQISLEMKLTRPLYFFMEHMLEASSKYRELLVRELPQLMCQEKLPINQFMNSHQDVHLDKKDPCVLETNLNSISLPFLGDSEPRYI